MLLISGALGVVYPLTVCLPCGQVQRADGLAGAPEHAKGVRGRSLAIAALVVLLSSAAVAYYDDDVATAIGPSCTVGVVGTAATLSVRGWQSGQMCDAFDPGTGAALYRLSGPITSPTICQYRIDHALFTVNDQGSLKVVGNVLCARLRSKPSLKLQTN